MQYNENPQPDHEFNAEVQKILCSKMDLFEKYERLFEKINLLK